ncbi:MAG: hypothetical protein QE263_00950 [Vampirovibrionales bacterium]|nr:hypothetical protein [Vampirovibrionales bacterium]
MGLQDWLDKAAPATGLLKGARGSRGLISPDESDFFNTMKGGAPQEGPTISRFTGLPVVPARLNLTRDPSTEPPVAPSTFVETPFPEASLTQPMSSDPNSSLPSATFTMDTDDLTDFNPLYPNNNVPPIEASSNSHQAVFSFIDDSMAVPHTAPVEEDFYVAPAETFAPTEPDFPSESPSNFAWPNLPEETDSKDSEPWHFTHNDVPEDAPEAAWELEESPSYPESPSTQEKAHAFPDALAPEDEDPFGLHEASDGFDFPSPHTSESFTNATSLDEFGLDDFGLELLSPKVPAIQQPHGEPHDEPSVYDPFTSDPLDADVLGHAAFSEPSPLDMDDLYPLYPADEQGLLSPSLTIEPPDKEPVMAWEKQQPWATHTEDASPLDVSPLHLLDPIEHDTFSSDWGLTLPESLDSHHTPLENNDDAEEEELWGFSEPLSSNATMEEAVDFVHHNSSALSPYTEKSPPTPFMPSLEEPLLDDWQGFTNNVTSSAANSIAKNNDDSLNPALDTLNLDDSWLHEAVPEDFMTIVPPPAPVETPVTQAPAVQTENLPPLAQAFTKNGQMAITLFPNTHGTGVLLKVSHSSLQSTDHVLKHFAKNPLHNLGLSTRMTLTEEARLKGKTLYRIELGNWRGIFSHSEKQGFVFQDEWQSD